MNIEDNIYNLKIPFVLKDNTSLEEKILYQMLDLPILDADTDLLFPKASKKIMVVSDLLKMNYQIELQEEENIGHSLRVAYLAKKICDELDISIKNKKNIYLAALFHDIGKIKVPTSILNKREKLTDDEYNIIKKHCLYVDTILNNQIAPEVIEMIKNHHERLDGSGYPAGKRSFDISSQIIGLVDSYDAMTSDRVYSTRKSNDEALKELYLCTIAKEDGGKGQLFNADLVEILKKVVTE